MKRRMALTFAGTAAIVLTAGSAAVAANLGILGSANQEPVGQLDANSVAELSATTSTSIEPIVVTIDEIVEVPVETPPVDGAPTAGSGGSGGSGGTNGGPVATSPTTARVDNSGPGSVEDGDHSEDEEEHSEGEDHSENEDHEDD